MQFFLKIVELQTVEPDQTSPSEAVWYQSALFEYAICQQH